ncbi:MAG: glycosyltransferase family 4 protein [Thermoflexales bacterium]|nr:glycosyltransferase family 4 protein [Thermoflexales bacterium]
MGDKAVRDTRIGLVAKPDKQMTGLWRYASSLYNSLRAEGVAVEMVHPVPPLPGYLSRAGKAFGLDAETFFASYPLKVRLGGVSVCHLASQNLATLLLFQRLPPTVVTVHDIIPHLVRGDAALNTYRHGLERLFDRLALRALRRAGALIAISEFTRQTVTKALAYPPERIHVVYRAVDRQVFKPLAVPAAFRHKYGLEQDRQHVLYVGSEDPRKNLESLVKALAIVRRRAPHAVLVKAGAAHFGAERERLLRLVESLGLGDSVRFLDHVSDEDLPWLYNAADVFVLPSFYEGFGLPALEAASCGTPVIAANRASLPEVVGEGGVLVDPDDEQALACEIVALLAEPERRAAASQAALHQAGRFSLERQAAETLAVYRELG